MTRLRRLIPDGKGGFDFQAMNPPPRKEEVQTVPVTTPPSPDDIKEIHHLMDNHQAVEGIYNQILEDETPVSS